MQHKARHEGQGQQKEQRRAKPQYVGGGHHPGSIEDEVPVARQQVLANLLVSLSRLHHGGHGAPEIGGDGGIGARQIGVKALRAAQLVNERLVARFLGSRFKGVGINGGEACGAEGQQQGPPAGASG